VLVSEGSVYGQLAPLFWGLCQGRISWWESVTEEVAYLMVAGSERERKGQGPTSFFKSTAPMTGRPLTRPHLLQVPPSPNSPTWETKPSLHRELSLNHTRN
jgi:hypothetical protein